MKIMERQEGVRKTQVKGADRLGAFVDGNPVDTVSTVAKSQSSHVYLALGYDTDDERTRSMAGILRGRHRKVVVGRWLRPYHKISRCAACLAASHLPGTNYVPLRSLLLHPPLVVHVLCGERPYSVTV